MKPYNPKLFTSPVRTHNNQPKSPVKHQNTNDNNHSPEKTSPTMGSPRRIPRLVKQPNVVHSDSPSPQRNEASNVATQKHSENGPHPQFIYNTLNNSTNGQHMALHEPITKFNNHIHPNSHISQKHTNTLQHLATLSDTQPHNATVLGEVQLRNSLNILKSPVKASQWANEDAYSFESYILCEGSVCQFDFRWSIDYDILVPVYLGCTSAAQFCDVWWRRYSNADKWHK